MTDKNRNEMLFEALMKISVCEAFENEMDALPSEAQLSDEYKPSAELDRRIKKLIEQNRRRSGVKHFLRGAGKVAACIAIIFTALSVTLLSVRATRSAILNAIVEWTEKYAKIEFKNTSADQSYRPETLPGGFDLTQTKEAGNTVMLTYMNETGIQILLKQRPAEMGTSLFDNENMDYKEIDISGNPAYLFEAKSEDDNSVLIWQSDGMVFELTSEIDSTELIFIGGNLIK